MSVRTDFAPEPGTPATEVAWRPQDRDALPIPVGATGEWGWSRAMGSVYVRRADCDAAAKT
jgi:hypothetical protein